MCVHTHVWMHVEVKGQHWSNHSPTYFLRQGLSWNPALNDQATNGWSASSRDPAVSAFPALITGAHHHTWPLMWVLGIPMQILTLVQQALD